MSHRPPRAISWPFPASTTHDGIPLGNGLFGAMLWGSESRLAITINRADYWDHRGGIVFGPEATYANLRYWLETGDETSLRRVFEGESQGQPGEPRRPTRLPMGRVDLGFDRNVQIEAGQLDLATGCAQVQIGGPAPTCVQALTPRGRPLLALRISGYGASTACACSQPAPLVSEEVAAYWRDYGLAQPELLDDGAGCAAGCAGGWIQRHPADPPLCVLWAQAPLDNGDVALYISAAFGDTPVAAREAAHAELAQAQAQGWDELAAVEAAWWRRYWQDTACVQVPDAAVQQLYELGMAKLPGISWPSDSDRHDSDRHTPAATLQGPWVEEYRLPPWSADYHFNINVQECYWPAYGGNQIRSLEPLWAMLKTWQPTLRENARQFLGIDDGLMLNHAVDDRGTCMGGFWTGAIDHGSTAWVAHMMWQAYRYTLDQHFLAETAYPFMRDAMRVYEAMLERDDEGRYNLPVSVSPEYEGAAMWAWGRNASFQLAIIHALARALVEAAEILGLDQGADADHVARWREIDAHTPPGSIAGEGDERELELWDGQPLAHSHRHHSHLAGLYPFDTLDPLGSADDATLVRNSLRTWTRMGMGEWSGWCLPWAAILWARMGAGERAALMLHEFRHAFMRPGHASTHDAVIPGLTIFDRRPDVMQIEATMAAANAVLEMLCHTASGVLRIFVGVPATWRDVSFTGIRTEGAFLVSAQRVDGKTRWVRVRSTKDSLLRMALPFDGNAARVHSTATGEEMIYATNKIPERQTVAGEVLTIVAPED